VVKEAKEFEQRDDRGLGGLGFLLSGDTIGGLHVSTAGLAA
jgi:hypothetical protein